MPSPAQFLSTAKIIIQLVPFIAEAIKAAEQVFSEPDGKGSEKLKIVRVILQTAYASLDDIWEPVQKIIAVIVSAYNATGFFKTSTPPA